MKKNISINLQGLIFHIEEDGYEQLGRYLAEVKAHFARFRGHQDIVADIEGRMAEIFAARLSPTKQVITLADVQEMEAKMGRVSDFETETDDEEELELAGAASATSASAASGGARAGFDGEYGAGAGSARPVPPAAETAAEPRRLYRDMAHRKLAGVCAGLAQYFNTNPLWFRLGGLSLIFVRPLFNILTFDTLHLRNRDEPFGFAVLAYIILWIVLPKRYDAPAPIDTLGVDTGPLAGRKLYRDTSNAKIGGVAAGLAAYFRTDPTLIRILLLVSLFLGGFGLIVYIVLWIALPVAKTLSEKMQMRGDAVNLAGFASTAQAAGTADAGPATAHRPLGTFLEDLARSLSPLVSFIGAAIRVFAGVLLTIIGFSFVLTLLVLLGVGAGLLPSSNRIIFGDTPAYVFLNGVPAWGQLSGLLALGIPALSVLLGGLGLLSRRRLLTRSGSLSLLGLWLLSLVGLTFTFAQQSREYQYEGEIEQVERYPALTTPVLYLDARDLDRNWEQRADLRLAAADSAAPVEVRRTLSAKGPSEEEARRTAAASLDYTVRLSGDSSLIFDDAFSFLPQARYRDQRLRLTLRLPRNRTFRLSRQFASLLGDEGFVGNHRPDEAEQYRYRLRGSKLECLNCPDAELGRQEEDANGAGFHRDSDEGASADEQSGNDNDNNEDTNDDDSDSDNASGNGLSLNYGGAPAFNTDLASYGGSRRSFEVGSFERVAVVGGYRVVVRPGTAGKITAAGKQADLDDLIVEVKGDELSIQPRRRAFNLFGNWNDRAQNVLVRVEMPRLASLKLAGVVRADVAGLPRQDRLQVEQAGGSHLRLSGTFGTLKLAQAGLCRTTAVGQADDLDLSGAGACELAAAGLQTRRADVSLAGACKARLDVSERLKSSLVGASEVAYSGAAADVKTSSVGASSVKRVK